MNYNELWRKLAQVYDEGEAKAIARMVYEVRYGLTFADLCLGKDRQLSADRQTELEEIADRLMNQEPVQYVLEVADFCGRQFHVAPGVLVPRPETEELCRWIIQNEPSTLSIQNASLCHILDVGTGSGCIAVTLAAELPETRVTAWDISPEALAIAQENARRHGVSVKFEQVDMLKCSLASLHAPLPSQYDLIVSNPPYICNKERGQMAVNVLEYEPHTALFVPDDDPLLFYRAIAAYATKALRPSGWLYFEINPLYAAPLQELLRSMSFSSIEIKTDAYGKQRMLRAQR